MNRRSVQSRHAHSATAASAADSAAATSTTTATPIVVRSAAVDLGNVDVLVGARRVSGACGGVGSSVDNIEKSVDTTAGIVAAARAKAQKVVAGTSFLCETASVHGSSCVHCNLHTPTHNF